MERILLTCLEANFKQYNVISQTDYEDFKNRVVHEMQRSGIDMQTRNLLDYIDRYMFENKKIVKQEILVIGDTKFAGTEKDVNYFK